MLLMIEIYTRDGLTPLEMPDVVYDILSEPNPILPRPEVSAEKQAVYERRLGDAALQRTSPNTAQDKADEVRRRYQYGSDSHNKTA